MSLFGGKTKAEATAVFFFFFFFLFIFVFQIWVCSDCQAEAVRIFPATSTKLINKATTNFTSASSMTTKSFKQDLIHKYFHGRAFNINTTTTHRDDKGFEQDKRRVPNCPDPLHN